MLGSLRQMATQDTNISSVQSFTVHITFRSFVCKNKDLMYLQKITGE